MTKLVVSLQPTSLDDLKAQAQAAFAQGGDMVEVRIDEFEDDPANLAEYLKKQSDHAWIVTCRTPEEGGHFTGDTRERMGKLIAAARNTHALVDFEWADWQRSDNIRQKVRLAATDITQNKVHLILSSHDFTKKPDGLCGLIQNILKVPELTSAKIAYLSSHIVDSFEALDLMHRHGSSVTAIAMGEPGSWTRILAKKLGGFSSYCVLDGHEATAPGQFTLKELIEVYHWPSISKATKVFGVVGDPVAHSLSPILHNHWFAQASIDAVYLPLRVQPEDEGLKRFLDGCGERDWLHVTGLSVTLPHKTKALEYAGDGADSMAHWVGAANTLHFLDGKLRAYNTDAYAATSSIAAALKCQPHDLHGVMVDVLGTGGAAKAILYALYELGCKVTLFGRNLEKTKTLATQHNATPKPWEDRVHRQGKIVINTTSVGLSPNLDDTPLLVEAFSGCDLVFDVIYNPWQTKLLKDAASVGIQTLNGLDMFIRQAAVQFAIWTGKQPDTESARQLLEKSFHNPTTDSA